MATYTYVGDGSTGDGATFGVNASSKVGHYGIAPVTQRALAAQATSTIGTASSADVTTDLKATVIEIMSTLTALGLWKGSA